MTISSHEVEEALARCEGIFTRLGVPGSACTTFAIGGPLAYLVEPKNTAALSGLMVTLHDLSLPFRILGAGSNVLVPDEGVSEIVIRLGEGFRSIERRGDGLFGVGASVSVMRLSRDLSMGGFAGLEFAGGIPASFGGAAVMNAGAHGGEFGDILERVTVVLPDGSIEVVERQSLAITYRHGGIPAGSVVVSGEIRLVPSDAAVVAEKRALFLAHRKKTQPLHLPSAGSVFRNPVGHYAGELIEGCGLKGYRSGAAQISPLHANWIVNPERAATALDVRALIARAIDEVQQHRDIELVPEVRLW